MKTMNCRQLGGACDEEFHAETFTAIAELSKQHAMRMFQCQDPAHLEAMQSLMEDPKAMAQWFETKQREFDSIPQN